MAGSNMPSTEKLPTWVIGKLKRLRCLKGTQYLPSGTKQTRRLESSSILLFVGKLEVDSVGVPAIRCDKCHSVNIQERYHVLGNFSTGPTCLVVWLPCLDSGKNYTVEFLFAVSHKQAGRCVEGGSSSPVVSDANGNIRHAWNCYRHTGFKLDEPAIVAQGPATEINLVP